MTNINIVELPGETDPSRIVEAWLSNKVAPMPQGYIAIAPVTRETKGPLLDAVDRLKTRRHNANPILIGVVHDIAVVDELVDAFSTTLLVGSNKEDRIGSLLQFQQLLIESERLLGTVGSVRVYDVPVSGVARHDPNLETKLAQMKGEPLHSIGRVPHPDMYAIAAPGDYIDPSRRALGDQAPILGTVSANENRVHVGAFTFDEEGVRDLVADARPQPTADSQSPSTDAQENVTDLPAQQTTDHPEPGAVSYEKIEDDD